MPSRDLEHPEFYHVTTPRTRHRRRCDECRGWLEAGERYARISGKWDGTLFTYTFCPQCHNLIREANKHLRPHDVGFAFGELHSDLRDLINDPDPPGPWQALLDRLEAIRIHRGTAICPIYREEESTLPEP